MISKEQDATVKDTITGTAVEEAVISFFEGIDLSVPGEYSIADKQISITRDENTRYRTDRALKAVATIDGAQRAVISSYYEHVYSAYFRLMGEEINGERDEVIFNRGIYGEESIMLSKVPGIDLANRKVAFTQAERLEIARRLGIKENVPYKPLRSRILR